jgi:hypothetical protein
MALHQDGIGEGPEMFSGLQFRRIRRQKEQVDVIRDAQASGIVCAGPRASRLQRGAWKIPGEHDALI